MSRLFTFTLECDGDCGARIEITSRIDRDPTDAAAEAMGWTTRDVPSRTRSTARGTKEKTEAKMEVYCDFCQERAQRITGGR